MGRILKCLGYFILGVLYLSSLYANNFAYIIVDGQSGKVMAQHRADELRPPASLTKKMTLYLLFEALHAGKISLKTQFSVSKRATNQEPSKLGLRVGEKISVKNIIYSLITRSANDMAIAAAEGLAGSVEAFSNLMNKKAKALGMTRTKFYTPHGLPARGQVTNARDMMILARALHTEFPLEYAFFKTKEFRYNGKPVHNHNRMLKSFTGMDGIKTGFTFASRFNISASAQRIGNNGKPIRVFAVVLGGQTSVSRDKKTAELMERAFNKLNAAPRIQQVATTVEVETTDGDIMDALVAEVECAVKSVAKKANTRKTLKKKTEAKAVQASKLIVLNDPIEEILNASAPISIDINRNLPTGWVKANPA